MSTRTGSPFQPTIPQVTTPFVDLESGIITPQWLQLLIILWQSQAPGAIQPITLTGSPLTFIAPSNGVLVVDGGTVTISRGGSTPVAVAGGAIPLGKGDQAIYTYTGTPNASFWPG